MLVVQQIVPGYRLAFFDQLAERLGQDLLLVSGDQKSPFASTTTVSWRRGGVRALGPFRVQFVPWQCVGPARTFVLEFNPRLVTTWLLAVLGRVTGRRVVLWGHRESRSGDRPLIRRILERTATQLLYYTPGEVARHHQEHRRGTPPVSINNTVEVEVAEPVADRNDVVLSARLIAEKDPCVAVEMLAHFPEPRPTLQVIGDGPLRAAMERRAEDLEVPVRFHGAVYDNATISRIYATCAVAVSPGYAGLNVNQALLSGVPFVYRGDARHAPEISYVGESNSVGVEGNDPRRWARAVQEVLSGGRPGLRDAAEIARHAHAELGMGTMVANARAAITGEHPDRKAEPRRVLAIAPFPPPVHGASKVSEAVATAIEAEGEQRLSVVRLDTSADGGITRDARYHVRRLVVNLAAVTAVARAGVLRSAAAVYIGGSGGAGIWYQVAIVGTARLMRVPIVFHHHSFDYLRDGGKRSMQTLSGLMSTGDRHVFLSRGMAQQFQERYRPDAPGVVCSNISFVDAPRTEPAVPQDATVGPRLIHVSNMSREKGSLDVLEIHRHLRLRGTPASLVLIGPATEEVHRAVEDVRREVGGVRELGPQPTEAIMRALAEADVFLFPTRYSNEAEPLVVLEALVCGVPVLASRRGSIPELLPEEWIVDDWTDGLVRVEALIALTRPERRRRAEEIVAALRADSTHPVTVLSDIVHGSRRASSPHRGDQSRRAADHREVNA